MFRILLQSSSLNPVHLCITHRTRAQGLLFAALPFSALAEPNGLLRTISRQPFSSYTHHSHYCFLKDCVSEAAYGSYDNYAYYWLVVGQRKMDECIYFSDALVLVLIPTLCAHIKALLVINISSDITKRHKRKVMLLGENGRGLCLVSVLRFSILK